MAAKLDLEGVRFGRLICLESESIPQPNGTTRVFWKCVCDCGIVVLVHRGNLRGGHTMSCGCLKLETSKTNPVVHGMYGSPEYRAWTACKTRCNNPNTHCYKDYGGRGIKVCEDWVDSFENFYRDMGPKPSNKHTLERVDVNGDYCKANCIWDTYKNQAINRRVRKDTSSGTTGVSWDGKLGKWRAYIYVDGKNKFLIQTTDLELAVFCREEAELHYFGKILSKQGGVDAKKS